MPTRRALLLPAALLATMPRLAFGQAAPGLPPQVREKMTPTPRCESANAGGKDAGKQGATPPQTEGPYYTPRSPARANLVEPDMRGTPLRIGGYVLTRSCLPVPGALVDLWQADPQGRYDNDGYRLRGHQLTDVQGRWQFETLVPGLYPGRTRHIHFKVQPPGGDILTTQLYFPDEPRNARDGLFSKRLLMEVAANEAGQIGRFDFVLDIG